MAHKIIIVATVSAIHRIPPRQIRCGIVRLYRIVHNNELPTTPGKRTANGRSQAEAALCRAHLTLCVLSWIDTRFGEEPFVLL